MQSNYPFLKRNQKDEAEKKRNDIDSIWSRLGSMGFVGKRSFFTGYGEDGVLQPNRPTGILNTSKGMKTVHEGEPVDIAPDGSFSVTPADAAAASFDNGQGQVNDYIPASQIGGQTNLQNIERDTNTEGFASGTPDKNAESNNAYSNMQNRGLQRLERYADTISPIEGTVVNAERERFAGKAASAKGALSQELEQTGTKGSNAIIEQTRLGRQIGAQENELNQSLRKDQLDRSFTATQQLPNAIATAQTSERAQESLDFSKQQWADAEGQRMLDDALVMEAGSWVAAHPGKTINDYNTARDQATLQQRQVSLSEQRFAGEEGQRMLNDALVMEESTWLSRHPNATAEDYKTARDQATLGQQSFELTKQRYGDSQEWAAYEAALSAGSFALSADLYKRITGAEISMDEMIKYQNYVNQKQSQDLVTGDLQNDALALGIQADRLQTFINAVNNGSDLSAANATSGLRLTENQFNQIRRDYTAEGEEIKLRLESLKTAVGQETFNAMVDRIGSGASRDMINDVFGTKLTPEDYMDIRRTTAFGRTEWERNLTAANMLMQTESTENILAASDMYEELFPGTTFNMRQLITDIGSERFVQGVTDLATLAATFDTWGEAEVAAERMGLFDSLGMDGQSGARELFQSLKINQIDEEWSAIEDSDFYQKLLRDDPEAADLIANTFSAGLSGELEFDIEPVYNVTDSQGRLVKSFNNIAEAEKYKAENNTQNYSIEEDKNYIVKDVVSGNTVTVNNGEVVNDNKGGEATFNADNLWSEDNYEVLNDPGNNNFLSALSQLTDNVITTKRSKLLRNAVNDNPKLKEFLKNSAETVDAGSLQHADLEPGQFVILRKDSPERPLFASNSDDAKYIEENAGNSAEGIYIVTSKTPTDSSGTAYDYDFRILGF